MIISASRRTDIPAFYTPWFMNRIREGFILTRNPYNANQVSRICLLPENVDAIVFWTRNPKMLMTHLDELDQLGFKYYFQYTITGYPRLLEKTVPRPQKAIQTFIELSDKIGSDKVIWRYDPILLSNIVDINEHKRVFNKIASMLEGRTKKVIISFSDFYKKTIKNLSAIDGLDYFDITSNETILNDLVSHMAETAKKYNMRIETCSEYVDLSKLGIGHAKCIDGELINSLFNISVDKGKDMSQREDCGCIKSVDIGSYNTCLHECAYCYATFNNKTVHANKSKHDPKSPFLIGGIDGVDPNLLLKPILQHSLF